MDRFTDLDSDGTRQLIACAAVLVSHTQGGGLWNLEETQEAAAWIDRHAGKQWTIQDLYNKFGTDAISGLMIEVMENRRLLLVGIQNVMVADAKKDACHLCGTGAPVTSIEFAVAQEVDSKRDWSSTVLTAALSAVTIPLFGAGRVFGPGRKTSYRVLNLHYLLCSACQSNRKGHFGSYKLSRQDYGRHPSVPIAAEIGYGTILMPGELAQLG